MLFLAKITRGHFRGLERPHVAPEPGVADVHTGNCSFLLRTSSNQNCHKDEVLTCGTFFLFNVTSLLRTDPPFCVYFVFACGFIPPLISVCRHYKRSRRERRRRSRWRVLLDFNDARSRPSAPSRPHRRFHLETIAKWGLPVVEELCLSQLSPFIAGF